MTTPRIDIGVRVQTPDGPGTVVSFWPSWEGLHRRIEIGVLLDAGQEWRKLYSPAVLDALERACGHDGWQAGCPHCEREHDLATRLIDEQEAHR